MSGGGLIAVVLGSWFVGRQSGLDEPAPATPGRQAAQPPTPERPTAPPASPAAGPDLRTLALAVASDVHVKGTGYDRALVARFQQAAGVKVDGIYGPITAEAVRRHSGQVVAPPSAAPRPQGAAPVAPAPTPAAPAAPAAGPDVRALALAVATDVRSKGTGYDRSLVARFQQAAGVKVDGIYGPVTAEAVRRHSGQVVPPPAAAAPRAQVVAPTAPPAAPPGSSTPAPVPVRVAPPVPVPQSTAVPNEPRALAAAVASDVRSKGRSYDRALVRRLQAVAPGLKVDGIYGPQTAGAVRHFSGQAVPPPEGPSSIAAYPLATAPSSPSSTPAKPGASGQGPYQVKDAVRLDAAKVLAEAVAGDVKAKGRKYDKALVARFQETADLKKDGIYGPASAGAVRWYTGKAVPPPEGRQGYTDYAPKF